MAAALLLAQMFAKATRAFVYIRARRRRVCICVAVVTWEPDSPACCLSSRGQDDCVSPPYKPQLSSLTCRLW